MLKLDETSVCYSYPQAQGNYAKFTRAGACQRPLVGVTRAELRGVVMHVGLICSKSHAQPHLPQVLIGNRRRCTAQLVREMNASKPPNVHLFREKSSWSTRDAMRRVLDLLAEAFRGFPTLCAILIMDTASSHLRLPLLRRAASLRIYLAPVPANLTHALQPLDVAAFSSYKSFLKNEYRSRRSQFGQVSAQRWLDMLFKCALRFCPAVAGARHLQLLA